MSAAFEQPDHVGPGDTQQIKASGSDSFRGEQVSWYGRPAERSQLGMQENTGRPQTPRHPEPGWTSASLDSQSLANNPVRNAFALQEGLRVPSL